MARVTHVRKVYEYSDGSTGRSAKPGWVKLKLETLAPEKTEDGEFVVLNQFVITPGMFGPAMALCAEGHGYSQKFGDDLANLDKKAADDGVKFDDETGYSDYIMSRFEAMADNLSNEVWVAEGEGATGAGNVTILFMAVSAVYEKAGMELDEEGQAKLRERLKDEDFRKGLKSRDDVNAQVQRIMLERQAARAAEAEAKAAASSETDLADLLA